MTKVGLCAIAVVAAMAGCAVDVEDPDADQTAETDQEVNAFPIPNPGPIQFCYYNGASSSFYGGYMTNSQINAGCTQTYKYYSGAQAGFLGGYGAYCPDSPYARYILRGKVAFQGGYCDSGVNVPYGQLFVFWSTWVGPGCPSGCEPRPYPGPI